MNEDANGWWKVNRAATSWTGTRAACCTIVWCNIQTILFNLFFLLLNPQPDENSIPSGGENGSETFYIFYRSSWKGWEHFVRRLFFLLISFVGRILANSGSTSFEPGPELQRTFSRNHRWQIPLNRQWWCNCLLAVKFCWKSSIFSSAINYLILIFRVPITLLTKCSKKIFSRFV